MSYSEKSSTAGERRAIRALAEQRLKGKTNTPSANRFLRKEIPRIRDERAKEANKKENARNRQSDIGVRWPSINVDRSSTTEVSRMPRFIYREPSEEQEPTNYKTYGGYPSDNNPQTQARAHRFEKSARRSTLELLDDTTLKHLLSDVFYGDEHSQFTATADPDKVKKVRELLYHTLTPFNLSEREKFIDAVLEVEKYGCYAGV